MSQEDRAAPSRGRPPGHGEIPAGWAIATLGQICEVNPRKPAREALPDNVVVSFVPMPAVDATTAAITNPQTRLSGEVRKGFTAFRDGDVIFAKITPSMENGKAAVARNLTNGHGFGSTEFHVLRPRAGVVPEYVLRFIRQDSFRAEAALHMTGTAGQKRVPADFLREAALPLPPIAEQQRIADQLDSVIARVLAAQHLLSRTVTLVGHFRRAALAAACLGELTDSWRRTAPSGGQSALDAIRRARAQAQAPRSPRGRQKRPFWEDWEPAPLAKEPTLPAGWAWVHAGCVYAAAGYGTSARSERNRTDGIPVVGVPNITSGHLDPTGAKRSTLPAEDLRDLILVPGDLVVCRTNGSLALVGKAAVVPPLDQPHAFASYLIRIRTLPDALLPEYLHAVLSSPLGRAQIEAVARSSAGQFNLSLGFLGGLAVPLPPLAEQREIVQRLSRLLSLADAIEERTIATDAKAVVLMRSVLATAFAGRLVPTEAALAQRDGRSFEDGQQLLQRIASQQISVPHRYELRQDTGAPYVVAETEPMKNLEAISKTYLRDILAKRKAGMTPEELFAAADLDVDDFYTQLKREVVARGVQQSRKDKQTVLLEAAAR